MSSTVVRLVRKTLGVGKFGTFYLPPVGAENLPIPPTGTNPPSSTDEQVGTVRLVAGAIVPGTRYRLRNWRGEGAMGTVYEAEHIDLERPVALKVLHHHVAKDPAARDRFRDEAKMTISIDSPNVVKVLDFGFLPDGRAFYVMELLDGHSLASEVEGERACSPERVLGVMRQLCKGLAEAHRMGVIHRDVKPDNVLIVHDRGRDIAKLVDFGIASQHREDSEGRMTAGTPHYMAPEQIQGQPFDGRLDIYALGATAYELLTGVVPFEGTTVEKVLTAHLDNPALPPSSRRPDLNIPRALEAVVLRCLEKHPDDRYADAEELEAALCEAQIDDGLRTEWDDLPLPHVDERRRTFIAEHLPGKPIRRRRLRMASILLPVVMLGGAAALHMFSGPAPEDLARVDVLVDAAEAAAGDAIFVYPPPDDPTFPTAYQRILELERLEGSVSDEATSAAARLRESFASALLALGDEYWEDPTSRPYARDYYAQALVFDPELPRAQARAGFTRGELSDLRQRAQEQDFSPPELEATAPLRVLADDDTRRRQRELRAVTEKSEALASVSQAVRLGSLAEQEVDGSSQLPVKLPNTLSELVTGPAKTEVATVVSEPLQNAAARAKQASLKLLPASKPPRAAGSTRNVEEGNKLAAEGKAALSKGARVSASELFERAIAADPQNADALLGLSDIAFDRGAYDRALYYAQRAVRFAPDEARIHMRLGDAYFKVLRFDQALSAYERAQTLGEASAGARVARVQELIKR